MTGRDPRPWRAPRPACLHDHAVSPSHVVRINPQTLEPVDVLVNDGRSLSASSVAAVHQGTMLVGPVFDPHLLRCRL